MAPHKPTHVVGLFDATQKTMKGGGIYMVGMQDMTEEEMAVVKAHLPELMVMARARHASDLQKRQIDISLCGAATTWEECCTITDMDDYTQAMLWYNVEKDTHGVALELNC